MEIIANILVGFGAFLAAVYSFVLSKRLRRFSNLEEGMGAAIAVLSTQVSDMSIAIERANLSARSSGRKLEEITSRAEIVARRLERLIASLHDIPETNFKESKLDGETDNHSPSFVRSGFERGQKVS